MLVGGLVWRRATAQGASAGLAIGIAVWAYPLQLPVLIDDPAFKRYPQGEFETREPLD